MSRHLLDLNTLLALLDPLHVFHEAAHHWVEITPSLRFLTCPLVQNGEAVPDGPRHLTIIAA